jgi:2-aminoadipate transaminase
MRTTDVPVQLSRRLRDVRGSAIRDLLTLTARDDVLSLAGGLPAADLLPRGRIAVAADRALSSPASVQYGEIAGLARLRDVAAAHETARLERPVAPTDVIVTSGSQQALDLLARAVLDPGDPVVVEDPCYVGALQVFQAAGADVRPVPLDADGLRVDVLAERPAAGFRPRLVHTVSSFHNPRGVTLSQDRRRELAALADRYGFLVVEDDP